MARAVLPAVGGVEELRRAVARDYEFFEVRVEERQSDWRRGHSVEPFDWEAPLPLTGAKRFFFPARETLVSWQGHEVTEVLPEPIPFALVGLRPCDLAAIAYQDRFFAKDLHYVRRRERALLVAVNCTQTCVGGFCREVKAGPFAVGGYDLCLTRLPDGRVAVEAGSSAGCTVLDAVGVRAAPFDAAAEAAFAALADAARSELPKRPFVARAVGRLNARVGKGRPVSTAEWDALGPSCLHCTGCSNICPTCSCFTVVDEGDAHAGVRARCWDSCLLAGFQREASGHNPSSRPGDRVRRFWYHKFSDDFAAQFGRPGCVGCGRCDVTCPGSIGALRVLARLGGED